MKLHLMCPFGQSDSRDITFSDFQLWCWRPFLKIGFKNTFPPFLGDAWGLIFLQKSSFCQINQEIKVEKMVTDRR